MDDPKLQADIEAIIMARRDNPGVAARRILLIPRIREALFGLEQREAQLKPRATESSDLR